MQVDTFILLSASEVTTLANSLKDDLDDWIEQWFPIESNFDTNLEISLASELMLEKFEQGCKYFNSSNDQWVALIVDEEATVQLCAHMLAQDPNRSSRRATNHVVSNLVQEALCALMDTWLGIEDSSVMSFERNLPMHEAIPNGALQPGQGVQLISISLGQLGVTFCLPNRAIFHRVGRTRTMSTETAPELLPARDALANQPVLLRAELGELNLTLGALGQLQPGDVIRLEKPISAPLSMYINESTEGFSGFLGQQNDRLAFRVNALLNDDN